MVTVKSILEKHPWATPRGLFNEVKVNQKIDYFSISWQLEPVQMELVDKLFSEIENWFEMNNKQIDVTIYGVTWLFDSLRLDLSSNTREVFLIVDKYKEFSRDLYYKDEDCDEEVYEDKF